MVHQSLDSIGPVGDGDFSVRWKLVVEEDKGHGRNAQSVIPFQHKAVTIQLEKVPIKRTVLHLVAGK